jgi:hypothetical protein
MTSRPVLRAVKKAPFAHIQFPKFDLPPNMAWGATQPPRPGYEKFYAESIRSVLCLPTKWNTYESELKVRDKVVGRFLLSSAENPLEQGFFNTGVTYTLFEQSDPGQLKFIAESIRQNTIKEMNDKMGGSTEWMKYGESMLICSFRYSSQVPEIKFANNKSSKGEAEMVFIQDIVLEQQRGIVFLMKFETPKVLFTKEMEERFRTIKTSGFYVINQDPTKTDQDDNGFVFLQL